MIQLNDEGLDVESLGGDESADDDLHRYREILYSIGDFARHSADTSLPLLSKYTAYLLVILILYKAKVR